MFYRNGVFNLSSAAQKKNQMSIWILKAAIQKVISFLPASQRINYFFQKHITKGIRLTDDLFDDKLTHCRNHLLAFEKYRSGSSFIALELGTGWHPVVPMGLFLCGAEKIYTADIASLLKRKNILQTAEKFSDWNRKGKLKQYLPAVLPARMNVLAEIANSKDEIILSKLNIHTVVGDARHLLLEKNSIDLIVSNNTLEHIYPEILSGILKEFKRVGKTQAVMSHFIDMSDHFAHLDKSITIYNFLKFSDFQWKLIDNSIQPQNRLRIYDYRELYKQQNIPILEEITRSCDMNEYNKIKVHEKYSKRHAEENAVSHASITSVL